MNKADFPILKQQVHGRELVYLDNAATSQKPQPVLDAIVEAYSRWNSNIHRGVHHLSQVATSKHEGARQAVADFINAREAEEIVFTKGTTDAINALAFAIGEAFISKGDEIIVSGVEHHSNIVPWQMLCERKKAVLRHIPLREDLSLDLEAFRGLLSDKTKLVSVAHVSNVLGTIQPIEEIIRLAHAKNVPVCIDGAQSVPHMKVNVQALDCDFLAFSGHKIYGPTGIGVLYGKRAWLEKLPPHEGGGEMINHVRWSGTTYNELPYKFEAGTPNFVGSWALKRAIEYIEAIGWEAIEAHEKDLTEYCEEQLLEAGCTVYGAGQKLDQQGVAVRTGHHCAEPLIDAMGVPGTVRVSFGLYNDKADVDAFITALKKAQSILM